MKAPCECRVCSSKTLNQARLDEPVKGLACIFCGGQFTSRETHHKEVKRWAGSTIAAHVSCIAENPRWRPDDDVVLS